MSQAVAVINPASASPDQIRDWAIAVRALIPDMTPDRLGELEAMLIAVKHRLRQLNRDVSEAERTRIITVQRIGELLGEPKPPSIVFSENNEKMPREEQDRRYAARLLAEYPEVVNLALARPKVPPLSTVVRMCKRRRAELLADEVVRQAGEAAPPAENTSDEESRDPVAGWWSLGDHLLYCGDSADREFVERAAGSAFAFADPPYNAGKADWDYGFKWRHDYLVDVARLVAVTPGISAVADFFASTAMRYRWSMAAWITNGMTRGAIGFGNWIYLALFSTADSIHIGAQDHLRVTVDASPEHETTHESRKPARLLVDLIEMFTAPGDTVVDPFLGSGTTLFAAEQSGRRCIGAEIDPRYAAQIVARFGARAARL